MSKRTGSAAKAPGHAPAAAGADNNTRLAFLEEGVSQLGLKLLGIGVTFDNPDHAFGAALDAIVDRNQRLDAFHINVSLLAIALSGAGVTIPEGMDPILAAISFVEGNGNATDGELAAIKRADEAEAKIKVLELAAAEDEEALAEMTNLRNAAINELQAIREGRPAEAAPEPEAEVEEAVAPPPAVRPEAARDVGPTFAQGDAKDIAAILSDGTHELELAYSNGEYELIDFGPSPIDAGVLVYRGHKFHVEPAIHLKGGPADVELNGVGLIVDGEQFAYCEFPEPQAIASRSERKLERMITFG